VLLPLAALFFYALKWKAGINKKLGDERLIKQLTAGYHHKKYKLKISIVLAAIALGIIALANLRKPVKDNNSAGFGVNVMVALDVSKSMQATDVKPSRLDKSKQFLYDLIDKLNGNKVGLVVFAGNAYVQMPLTADVASSKMFISNASPDFMPVQGTAVARALQVGNGALDTKEKKYKAIVLVTDGETHDAAVTDAITELEEAGTVVYTVGLGSINGSNIIDEATGTVKKDAEGNAVVSKLNEELLQQIATGTNGKYVFLSNTRETATDLANNINAMEKTGFGNAGNATNYFSLMPIILAVVIALLIAELFISERRKNSIA